jgi:GntR family transcriptional regulator/MocR family aminotransferase
MRALKAGSFSATVPRINRPEQKNNQSASQEGAFGREWIAYGDSAGLHVAIDFPGKRFDEGFRNYCLQNGLYITPVESYCIEKGRHQSKLLIGYGHLEPAVIKKGVELLSDIITGLNI